MRADREPGVWGWAVALAASLIASAEVLAIELPREVRLTGPGPLTLVSSTPALPDDCRPLTTRSGCTLHCLLTSKVRLTLAAPGYETRQIELAGDLVTSEVDLRDGRWVPTAIPIVIGPRELAASVTAVWARDGEVETATWEDGLVAGPRVAPGKRFALALVGPETEAIVVARTRDVDSEPLAVQLRPGSSAVVACRDPWNWALVSACAVELGSPSTQLGAVGNSRLVRHGEVREVGDLRVLDLEEKSNQLVARAPGLPPTVRDVRGLPVVADLPLEPPRELGIVLEDRSDNTRIAGTVRILQDVDGAKLVVAEATVEPGAGQPVVLAAGRYTVFGEAPGYRPAEEPLVVDKPRADLTLRLAKAATTHGRVIDSAGVPLVGVAVVALTQGHGFESMSNATLTDAAGRFEATLPGDGPWTLLARLEGYSGPPLHLSTPDDEATLVLECRCAVSILPLQADGSTLAADMLVLMRPQTLEVVAAQERAADGWFRLQLSPGEWIAIAEELGLRGRLSVPVSCRDWRSTVFMQETGGSPQ